VKSWTEQTIFPVCILRYEDMKQISMETFEKAVRFAGLKHTVGDIARALEMSTFDQLQRQEKANGFKEKSPSSEMFFRKSKVGSWRDELSQAQVEPIIQDHQIVMEQFGYLTVKSPGTV